MLTVLVMCYLQTLQTVYRHKKNSSNLSAQYAFVSKLTFDTIEKHNQLRHEQTSEQTGLTATLVKEEWRHFIGAYLPHFTLWESRFRGHICICLFQDYFFKKRTSGLKWGKKVHLTRLRSSFNLPAPPSLHVFLGIHCCSTHAHTTPHNRIPENF